MNKYNVRDVITATCDLTQYAETIKTGDTGTIVHIYPDDQYEVEFEKKDERGSWFIMMTMKRHQMKPKED